MVFIDFFLYVSNMIVSKLHIYIKDYQEWTLGNTHSIKEPPAPGHASKDLNTTDKM